MVAAAPPAPAVPATPPAVTGTPPAVPGTSRAVPGTLGTVVGANFVAAGPTGGVARTSREEVAGGVYHVFARGNRKEPIFGDDADRRTYLAEFGAVAVDLGWRCLSYCLMT